MGVQQNIKLKRQLNDITQRNNHLEQHNQALQDELETFKVGGSCSRESPSPRIHSILQEEGVVVDEGQEVDDGEGYNIYDYAYSADDYDNDNEFRMQILPTVSHLARTPPAISLADEVGFSIYGSHTEFEDKEGEPMGKSTDALEEYIHLTAAAVKIRFHMVPIPSGTLIKRAHAHPFYRMHDELTKYMEEKLKEQESSPQKPEQDVHQEQESASMSKESIEQNPATKPNTQPSVFNKVRNLFRPKLTSG